MDIPDLVREQLDDEEITAGVSLGDENAVCLTPTRTLIYRGEGLLSDEEIEEFSHDIERLSVKEGRRKTKFVLEYVEGPESFTVPENRGDKVLELLLQGILRYDDVIGRRESIAGVYRFTELTLVITEGRILKHIGNHVWDDDFEVYPLEAITGVDFERASNATSISIEVNGRPQRIKVPNDTARLVRQTLEEVLFDYYDVSSLEEFNSTVGKTAEGEAETDSESDAGSAAGDIGFEEGIDPLVTDSAEEELDEVSDAPEPDHGSEGGSESESEGSAVPEKMDVSFDARADTQTDDGGTATAEDERASSSEDATDEPGTEPSGDETSVSEAGGTDAAAETESASGSGTETDAAAGETTTETESASGVSEATEATEASETESTESATASAAASGQSAATDQGRSTADDAGSAGATESAAGAAVPEQVEVALEYEPASQDDLAAVASQVEELTEAVERQNELLKRQHKAIKQLVTELRSE